MFSSFLLFSNDCFSSADMPDPHLQTAPAA